MSMSVLTRAPWLGLARARLAVLDISTITDDPSYKLAIIGFKWSLFAFT